jgi:hypothetical protein
MHDPPMLSPLIVAPIVKASGTEGVSPDPRADRLLGQMAGAALR